MCQYVINEPEMYEHHRGGIFNLVLRLLPSERYIPDGLLGDGDFHQLGEEGSTTQLPQVSHILGL